MVKVVKVECQTGHEHVITFGWLGRLIAGLVVAGIPTLIASAGLILHRLDQAITVNQLAAEAAASKLEAKIEVVVSEDGPLVTKKAYAQDLRELHEKIDQAVIASAQTSAGSEARIKNLIREGRTWESGRTR